MEDLLNIYKEMNLKDGITDEMLKDGEHLVIDNFLENNSFQNWYNVSVGIPMFFAPNMLKVDVSNDSYFLHPIFSEMLPYHNEIFDIFLQTFVNNPTGLRMDALSDVKILWYPKTTDIEEYDTFSHSKGSVDNLILFLDNNNGYVKLPDGNVIESIKNRLLIFKGNPRNIKHTTHSDGDNWLVCRTHIQCFLNEMPKGSGQVKTY